METLDTDAELAEAISNLLQAEPRFTRIVADHGMPPLRRTASGLESLLRIVADQLISLQAGAAIWKRLERRLQPFLPETILGCSEEELRSLGLSRAKARTFLAAAQAANDGLFKPSIINALADHAVHRRLTALPGIGSWTADIYLLAALGRADAWPAGDLALRVATQSLFELPDRPDSKAMIAIAEPWRPWRSAAARLLWGHYRGLKGMPQTVK